MNHTRLLAQIKLRETERQRDRLQKHYDAIEARVAQADSPLGRLRALHQGLREVTFRAADSAGAAARAVSNTPSGTAARHARAALLVNLS
jgi:hypothetical protein